MSSLFVNSFIPNATIVDVNIGNGIVCYEYHNSIYVLVNAAATGIVTKDLKKKIAKRLKSFAKPILYFSIFENRLHFANADEIAWGTYAWFTSEPEHYIHFDDHPSKQLVSQQFLS